MAQSVLTRWDTRIRYWWSSGVIKRAALYSAAALAVMWIVWIVVTGLIVRSDALKIRDRLQQVEAQVAHGDLAGARYTAAGIPALAHRAHVLTSGPAWWAAAAIPYVGDPFDIARGATTAADRVGADGIPELLKIADDLNPATLRTSPRTINLKPLSDAAPRLASTAKTLDAAVQDLNDTPQSSWLPGVASVRTSLATTLRAVDSYVGAASRAASVLPGMLGADGPQRYFVGLQNEAEMRGTGGLSGAFAIVVADHGVIRFTHFESDSALMPAATKHVIDTGLDFGADYSSAYGASGPTQLFVNSNLSPHFPYAAQIWAAMWQRQTGEHIDGAIAVDPQVLANFLAATGPVMTKEHVPVGSNNVVELTEQQEYVLFSDNTARKQFLVNVLRAAAGKILDGSADPVNLVRAMSVSAREHRVLVWSENRTAQAVIDQTDYSGSIPDDARPFVGLVLNNTAAGKLDYYLGRTIDYQRLGCGSSRNMIVTITLTNSAPATGLPLYVVGRPTDVVGESAPGDNRSLVDYYATAGAQLIGVTIDGETSTAAVLQDRGHPVYRFDLELPRGQSRTIVLHLSEPAGSGPVQVWQQPGVQPLIVTGGAQACG